MGSIGKQDSNTRQNPEASTEHNGCQKSNVRSPLSPTRAEDITSHGRQLELTKGRGGGAKGEGTSR